MYLGTPIEAPYENCYRHTDITMQFGPFSRLATFAKEQIGDTDTDLQPFPAYAYEVIDCASFPATGSFPVRWAYGIAFLNMSMVRDLHGTRFRRYWTWRTTDGADHPSVLADAADHDADQVGVDCGGQP
jgi:hypothetical protein